MPKVNTRRLEEIRALCAVGGGVTQVDVEVARELLAMVDASAAWVGAEHDIRAALSEMWRAVDCSGVPLLDVLVQRVKRLREPSVDAARDALIAAMKAEGCTRVRGDGYDLAVGASVGAPEEPGVWVPKGECPL